MSNYSSIRFSSTKDPFNPNPKDIYACFGAIKCITVVDMKDYSNFKWHIPNSFEWRAEPKRRGGPAIQLHPHLEAAHTQRRCCSGTWQHCPQQYRGMSDHHTYTDLTSVGPLTWDQTKRAVCLMWWCVTALSPGGSSTHPQPYCGTIEFDRQHGDGRLHDHLALPWVHEQQPDRTSSVPHPHP